jgi:DNA-binding NarL/FixJ family response regulator
VANSSWRASELARLLAEDQHLHVIDSHVASSLDSGMFAPEVEVVVVVGVDYRRVNVQHHCVVVISDQPDEEADLSGPVRAWLSMNSSAAQISAAITAAAQDFYVLTRDQVRDKHAGPVTPVSGELPLERLTMREKQVLRMIADGLGNKEIAHALNVSGNTAKFHVSQVLAKLGASSRAEAVRIGIRRGLVPI